MNFGVRPMIKVAIVGAGPAGAYCAYKLAENEIYPSIFDNPWWSGF